MTGLHARNGRRRPKVRRWTWVLLCAAVVVAGAGVSASFAIHALLHRRTSTVCIYPRESIAILGRLDALTAHDFTCVMTFANATATWQEWEDPWYITTRDSDSQWARWVKERSGRRLVITISLVPSGVAADWRQIGAGGAFDAYARRLGLNLVAAGLGDSVIRLAPEANVQTSPTASVGSTQGDLRAWARTWAEEAEAMRVPGSHFVLDWTVNGGYRDLPFAAYYPGDAAVDVIGIDQYDAFADGRQRGGPGRFAALADEPGGLTQLRAFAKSRGKPISVPEWGLVGSPVVSGGGDDAAYVSGMAAFFRTSDLAYESYFDKSDGGTIPLEGAPLALSTYRTEVLGEKDAALVKARS